MKPSFAWAARKQFALVGFAASVFFWIAASSLDALFFHPERGFLGELSHPSGHVIWMRLAVMSVLIAFGVYVDRAVADRRRTLDAVRAAEEFNREVLSSVHEGIVVYDSDLRYVYWNEFMERLTGLPAREVLGRRALEPFPHLREEGFDKLQLRALAGETVSSPDLPFLVERTGHRGWQTTTFSPHRNLAGEIVGVIGTVVDVTRRRNMETALQNAATGLSGQTGEEFFRSLVQFLVQAVGMDYAIVGRLVPGDESRLRTVAAYAKGGFIANNTFALAGTPSDRILATGPCSYRSGVAREFPGAPHLAGIGAESCAGIPLLANSGRSLGVMICFHDAPMADLSYVEWVLQIFAFRAASELERLEAEDKQRRLIADLEAKNEELDRFAYTISHDLKSPLISIKGFLGLLDRDLAAGDMDGVRRDLARVDEASERMKALLTDLLRLSRVGRTVRPRQMVFLGEIAGEVARALLDRPQGPRVSIALSPDLPAVFGDRERLVELMEILLGNAAQYMGGQPQPAVEVGVRSDGGEQVVFVRDNGIGIEPRHRERVFGLFERLDPRVEGSGVGLAIARRIVELHGGRIWVESEGSGRGSTFCFTVAAPPA